MPGSDATTLAPDGPLSRSVFHGAYSWAAWFYRFMVREWNILTPEDAIHRLTGLPARTLDIKGRGILHTGAHADIVICDADRFADEGDAYSPNRLATSVAHVLVNGAVTLRHGRLTGKRAGVALCRQSMG